MGKMIVFCADGTWNGPGQPVESESAPSATPATTTTTNVFKLFLNLAGEDLPGTMLLAKEQERVQTDADGTAVQHAKYLHGVGDSENTLVRLLGGILGAGLITRLVRGYTFISRNYVQDDQIVIVGFSRGAYTARALAGMIASMGLLDAAKNDLTEDNKDHGYFLGLAVWYAYRLKVAAFKAGWTEKLASIAGLLPAVAHQAVPDNRFILVRMEAVAVWDTVGSLGIPEYTMQASRLDAFQFADRVLSPMVNHGIHAVAVDERRSDFTPTLWDPAERILQALFPGCHSDVGGGFISPGAESGLSDCGLQWMMEQLAALGVTFKAPLADPPHGNPRGPAHAPWLTDIWKHLPQGARPFPFGLALSEEVVERAQSGPVIPDPTLPAAQYAPENLADYLVAGVEAPGVTVV